MDANIYQTPAADLTLDEGDQAEFYVVARKKFLVLYLGTLGLYEIYWFYQHWKCYRSSNHSSLWPVARAIFSIFFAHSLFTRIERSALAVDAGANWSPRLLAALYILFYLIANFSELVTQRFASADAWLLGAAFVAMFAVAAILFRVQTFANLACRDPQGLGNRNFTALNFLWIVLGSIFWLATLFGVALSYGWIDLSF